MTKTYIIMVIGMLVAIIGLSIAAHKSVRIIVIDPDFVIKDNEDSMRLKALRNILIVLFLLSLVGLGLSLKIDHEREVTREKVINAYEAGEELYIDGNPVSEDFDLSGINLNKYRVEFHDSKIYLID